MRPTRPSDFSMSMPFTSRRRRPVWQWCAAVSVAGAVGCGAVIWMLGGWRLSADSATPTAPPTPTLRIVACDASDLLSATQQDYARRGLRDDLPARFQKDDRVVVAQLGDNTTTSPINILFNAVDPGPLPPCNPLNCTENSTQRREQEAVRKKFLAAYSDAIQRCLKPGKRAITPLVEGFTLLGNQPDIAGWPTSMPREWTALTDGLQHTAAASFYVREPVSPAKHKQKKGANTVGDYTVYGVAGRTHIAQHQVHLRGADVKVIYLKRPDQSARQDWRAREWLENYLTVGGAQGPIRVFEVW